MNCVRKLGFEETPDYYFLRELFSKVLKNIGEQDDGVFDWMLINNGKGWEAGNVCYQFPLLTRIVTELFQTPASLLAQAHATANTPHTPRHRETSRRPRPQLTDGSSPSTPLVLAPTPAHVKNSTRRPGTREGHGNRDPGTRADVSVQPIAPISRRASQTPRESSGLSPHPYANAPAPSGFRASNNYGRHSPIPGSHVANVTNANNLIGRNEASDSFLYGAQAHAAKNPTNSREDITGGTLAREAGQMRGMTAFETQRHGVDEMDDDRHPKRKGFFSGLFCCRA